MKHLAAVAASLLFTACSVALEAPDDAVITCDSDAACPTNYQCELSVGRCFDTRVSLPRVFVEPVARAFGSVAVSITIADSDGDPASVIGEYDTGDGYRPATFIGATDLATSRVGTRHVITWNASADLGSNAYRTGLRLRLAATSGEGTGPTIETDLFAFGDDAPVASNVAVQGSSPFGGNVIIGFDVSDSSSDGIAIAKLEVSYDGTFTDAVVVFDEALPATAEVLPSGSVVDLASSPSGTSHAFTWSSTATSIVDAPSAVLRLTLRDAFLESAPANSTPFYLRNQLPPRLSSLVSPAAGTHRAAGPVPFSYRLIDENGEPAGVIFEYTVDGTHYSPCSEYPVAESEGTTGLATASEAVGGVEHVFVWDPTDVSLQGGAVAVRARAATPTDTGQTIALPKSAGAPLAGAYASLLATDGLTTGEPAITAIGDFNGDGFPDLTFTGPYGGAGVNDNVAFGCALVGCLGGTSASTDAAPLTDVVSIAAGDLNEDGTDDAIIVRDSVYVRLSTGTTRGAAATLAQPAVTGKALSGDFDGDGHVDVLLQRGADVGVLFGDGAGGLSPPVFTAAPGITGVELARVDGDAATDLYVTYGGHFAIFSSTRNRATPFDVLDTTIPAATQFASCDFNRDGLSDLVARESTGAALLEYVLESTGELRGPFALGVNVGSITDVACGDFDNDGASDLVFSDFVISTTAAYVAFNVGQSDGVAEFGAKTAFANDSGVPFDVMVTWKRRDGADLVAVGSSGTVRDIVLAGASQLTGMSTGMLSRQTPLGASGTSYNELAIADFDGDGVDDYLFNDSGVRLQLWRGTGVRGLASGAMVTPTTIPIAASSGLRAGDANADGKNDIWTAGQLYLGQGDGTFGPAVATSAPAGFRSVPAITTGPAFPHADFDGDGIPDRAINGDGSIGLGRGVITARPGTDSFSPYEPFPEGFPTSFVFGPAELSPYNTLFVADINDDGVPDLIQSSRRSITTFVLFFGQIEQTVPRVRRLAAFTPTASAATPVSTMAADLVGQRVAFHVARGATDDTFLWESSLIEQGLYAVTDTQRPFAVPYELRGEVRLTAAGPVSTSNPPLSATPRLPLDANQRGIVIDMPVYAGNEGAVNDAGNRVFVRLTDYDGLAAGKPKARFTWVEIPRDDDGDLRTGSGRRYVTAALGSGYVVRVLTDRGGIFASFTP